MYVCVCASHSVSRSLVLMQGGREDLQGSAQRSSLQDPRKRKLITSVYLLVTLHHFSRCLLFPWSLHDGPLNLPFLHR